MRKVSTLFCLVLIVMSGCAKHPSGDAQSGDRGYNPLTYDLVSDQTATFRIFPNKDISLTLLNKIPELDYAVNTSTELRTIPPLDGDTVPAAASTAARLLERVKSIGAKSPSCPAKYKFDSLLSKLTSSTLMEKDVPAGKKVAAVFVESIANEDKDACATQIDYATKWNKSTTKTVTLPAAPFGADTTIYVSRTAGDQSTKTWEYKITTGSSGEWRTSYGFALLNNKDRLYSARTGTTGLINIQRSNAGNDNLDVIPALFISWFDASHATESWDWGFNGGFGLDFTNPTVLAGLDISIHQNLFFNFGVAANKQKRLKSQYIEGQTLTATVQDSDLVEEKYAPTYYFAVTYRFGSNPFESGPDKSK